MSFAFRCPQTGLPDFADDKVVICPYCHQKHDTHPVGGVNTDADLGANVIGDRLTPYMDWSAGQVINSKSQRRRVYAAKGLREKSIAEDRRQHGGETIRTGAISYGGQKNRATPTGDVRTADGRRVV